MRWFLLFFVALFPAIGFSDNPVPSGKYYLVVDKSSNTITLFDSVDWLIEWPCTFGSKDKSDKMYQGDSRTPEGKFTITSKYKHAKWNKFMRIDYPTAADYQKFNDRKARGIIPKNAKIGGDIGIHGTWPREDFAVDYLQAWTLGCVSMKNNHLDELYNLVPVGTKVVIRR